MVFRRTWQEEQHELPYSLFILYPQAMSLKHAFSLVTTNMI